jgi:hypothetical protein
MTLMVYKGAGTAPANGADKYYGDVAAGYDAKREDNPKWHAEQKAMADLLARFPAGSHILDIPVGTGRYFDIYRQRKFIVTGMDKSTDMLDQALTKIKPEDYIELHVGDVRRLMMQPKSVDIAVMSRLTRWLSPEECTLAASNLMEVARKAVIFTARIADHPKARPLSLFEVRPDWSITEQIACDGPNYLMVMMEPIA